MENSNARQKLFDHHKKLTQQAFDILVAKNNDYASGNEAISSSYIYE